MSEVPRKPISELLTDLARQAPDRPAVTCGDVTLTRSQLEARANRLARSYEALGVRHGDFVTIALPNSCEFIEVTCAVWKLGAVPQPVSSRLPNRELQAIIDLADSRLVVGAPDAMAPDRPHLNAGFVPAPYISAAPIAPPRISPAWKAPTSGGSTGRPKLIVSTQTSEVDPNAGAALGMVEGGVQLVPGPLYHNAPFLLGFSGLFMGNHIVVLPRFDAVTALEAIAAYRVDFVNFVPTMLLRVYRALQDHPDRYDLSSLQRLWHMAAPCPEWLKEAWMETVGPHKVWELYGGTEGQSATIIDGNDWLAHRGSVGRPTHGEIRILDDDGNTAPSGEVGEIYMLGDPIAGPSYRYVGATAKRRGEWESLGDMGWMDDDGYLYITDRRTDMILCGGANIYPAEVESALLEHPGITGAVVVGLPDEELGQRVHAVITAVETVAEDQIRTFLAERLVTYKIPRSFRIVDTPLRDDAGKVRRSAVRDNEIAVMTGAAS
jgi:bile acid-coenzyme A ligase